MPRKLTTLFQTREVNGERITRQASEALIRMQDGPVPTSEWERATDLATAAAYRTPRALAHSGLARAGSHPTLINERLGLPQAALFLTDLGRQKLAEWGHS